MALEVEAEASVYLFEEPKLIGQWCLARAGSAVPQQQSTGALREPGVSGTFLKEPGRTQGSGQVSKLT